MTTRGTRIRLVRAGRIGLLALAAAAGAQDAEPTASPDPAMDPGMNPAMEMWLEIRDSDDTELLAAFVAAFPDSPYTHVARARLKRLAADGFADQAQPIERKAVRKRRRSR